MHDPWWLLYDKPFFFVLTGAAFVFFFLGEDCSCNNITLLPVRQLTNNVQVTLNYSAEQQIFHWQSCKNYVKIKDVSMSLFWLDSINQG